jgi:hypothetical protein
LSRIPGEERKFKRRRIVAFIPVCKRAREVAASQAETIGVSLAARGVDVASGIGVADGGESGVEVADGSGGGGGVAVESIEADVALGERGRGGVEVDSLEAEVPVAVGKGGGVQVGESDIELAVGEGIAGSAVRVIGILDS